ncbi:alkanesulfonate monooxygenase [Sphingobium sp. B1D7B]|uniref:LLM class flavin-dependent oxidoreductase n=1 Tax=Sphingobium sp. B1D7B TaxID=2940578 RepID=UPI002225136E|nr:LLM class flavin-dependent oxidoreductase [Sphingobium sp. B1D7B]MCW2404628.1 alkanesulfonate monooxygenase [Sphingobium sp. B1D7B]
MTLNVHWRLDPAAEPNRSEAASRAELPTLVRDRRTATQNRFDYYVQVAQAAAQTAFDGLLVRHRLEADESRIIAAVVARAVPRLLITPEFPASVGSAVYTAKQASTFQRGTSSRLGWAIAPDDGEAERERQADFISDDARGQRLDEFLTVARGVHHTNPFTFKGDYFEVENGGFDAPLNHVSFPTIFLQGDDEEALALSARHADVHLFQPAALDGIARSIARLNDLAAGQGRQVRAGIIQPLLLREDTAQAEKDVQGRTLSPGTLVAGYDDAAETLVRLVDAGISELVLEATPTLEETYRVGQHLLPRLRALTNTTLQAA